MFLAVPIRFAHAIGILEETGYMLRGCLIVSRCFCVLKYSLSPTFDDIFGEILLFAVGDGIFV